MPTRLLLACLFIQLCDAVNAAPMPRLDGARPALCAASATDKGEWVPTAAQVTALEKALPGYFAASKAPADHLPSARYAYKRLYMGITQGGERQIYGSFYPADVVLEPGSCPGFSDGGNAYWWLIYNPRTGVITAFGVNGNA